MYNYGGYPAPGGYYAPPMPDNLATLRNNPYTQPVNNQPMMPNSIQQPMQPANQTQAQPATMSGPVFVNGEAGAKGYLVAAGNTVMLIDADPDANTFWLKSADASGMPSIRTFDYTERFATPKSAQQTTQGQQPPVVDYVPRVEFNTLQNKFDMLQAKFDALFQWQTQEAQAPAQPQAQPMKEVTDNE